LQAASRPWPGEVKSLDAIFRAKLPIGARLRMQIGAWFDRTLASLSKNRQPSIGVCASAQARIRRSRQKKVRRKLDLHKYKVGQSVRYNSGAVRRLGANSSYKIVRLLPSEGDQQQYRIKSASEAHERIAKENELNLDF
jgi:hypothetical protein